MTTTAVEGTTVYVVVSSYMTVTRDDELSEGEEVLTPCCGCYGVYLTRESADAAVMDLLSGENLEIPIHPDYLESFSIYEHKVQT